MVQRSLVVLTLSYYDTLTPQSAHCLEWQASEVYITMVTSPHTQIRISTWVNPCTISTALRYLFLPRKPEGAPFLTIVLILTLSYSEVLGRVLLSGPSTHLFAKGLKITNMTKAPRLMPKNKNSCTVLLSTSTTIRANKAHCEEHNRRWS